MKAFAIGHTLENDLSPNTDRELHSFLFENLASRLIIDILGKTKIDDAPVQDLQRAFLAVYDP
jgi:hypothetical protein